MKLILIVTLVWLRMNLSEWVVRTQFIWMLLAMILHISHWVWEDELCDIDTVQDSLHEDMVSCLLSNKPSEYQKIWSIPVRQSKLCCGEHAHMHDLYPFTGVPL